MALLGCVAMWFLLNLMSFTGIDIYRTASVLGYCLLPMVILAGVAVLVPLNGLVGMAAALLCILWCAKSAALMFVTVLNCNDNFLLLAYPAALIYACFALLTVF